MLEGYFRIHLRRTCLCVSPPRAYIPIALIRPRSTPCGNRQPSDRRRYSRSDQAPQPGRSHQPRAGILRAHMNHVASACGFYFGRHSQLHAWLAVVINSWQSKKITKARLVNSPGSSYLPSPILLRKPFIAHQIVLALDRCEFPTMLHDNQHRDCSPAPYACGRPSVGVA